MDMFKFSNYVSSKISHSLNLDDSSNEVIAYGAFSFFQSLLSIAVVSIIGYILNILVETLIITFSVSILRKFSGGVHATTPNNCLIIGTIFCIIEGLLAKILSLKLNFNTILILGFIVFSLIYYLTYKLAPVESNQKPIKNVNRRIQLKRKAIYVISFYLLLFVVSTYCSEILPFSYSISLLLGILWQGLTLTNFGSLFINIIDNFLNKIWRGIYEKS